MTTGFLSVYVTAATPEEAEKIGLAVVEEKLAACANILPGVRSVYRWEGKVERADECAILFKTTEEKFDALQKKIREIHSYKCPCIVAWPIEKAYKTYLDWIKASVGA
jgi:periplasmic divalent cation tolerance protein